jgi:hypothetical protein
MGSDHETEIRASVAAHADLGPGYDDAVAEGLVERIGAEIDRRIDARLGQGVAGSAGSAGVAGDQVAAPSPGAAGAGPAGYPGYQVPAGYHGYVGPMLPPGYQMGPPPVRSSSVGSRNVATTVTALGSMALGVGATAIVSAHGANSGPQAVMVLLIWAAIAIINIAYARHR